MSQKSGLPQIVDDQFQRRPGVCTLTILIPRYYNPEAPGSRKKIEWHKLRLTLAEMHLLFSGYTARPARGWNREDNVRDEHLQFEVDFIPTPSLWESICAWKKMLERRFHQRAMYMKVSNGSVWL
jgi:hypothetical protein